MLKAAKMYTFYYLSFITIGLTPMIILLIFGLKKEFILLLTTGKIESYPPFIIALLIISLFFILILFSLCKIFSTSYLKGLKQQLSEYQEEIMELDFFNADKIARSLYISDDYLYCFFVYDAAIVKISDIIWVYDESGGRTGGYWYCIHKKNKQVFKVRLWKRSEIQDINAMLKKKNLPILIGFSSNAYAMYNDNFPQFKRMASIANKNKSKHSKR